MGSALNESISIHSSGAAAHWDMNQDFADCILSAGTWAWVYTFAAQTGRMTRTIWVKYTFWTAASIWVAMIFGKTTTYSVVTLSIWSARWWVTGIAINGIFLWSIWSSYLNLVTFKFAVLDLRGCGLRWQFVKGSPINPSGQIQEGIWFMTLQCASRPQDPGQGSMHFSRIHALFLIHSELMVHSGLQLGGAPM